MRLKQLIKGLDYQQLEDFSDDVEVKGISCNSEDIAPGYLFVAISGQKVDGHNFIEQAIAKGARALIIQRDIPLKNKLAKIKVKDSRLALASVCAAFFHYPAKQLKVIGITGTNGKTTVSYIIEKILAEANFPAAVLGTINYRIGNKKYQALNTTPRADRLQAFLHQSACAKFKYAIMEVSSHALDQHRVEGVDFSTAIFTNLSHEHLDYHRNLEDYFSCKLRLFEGLDKDAWAIINLDQPYAERIAKRIRSKCLTYGIEQPAQCRAVDLRLEGEKSRFRAITPFGNLDIESPLVGRYNVYNILAAISAALVEGIDPADIREALKTVAAIPGRLEGVDCGQNFSVYIDYAHTADALKQVLSNLKELKKGRTILVFGCGGDRDKAKRSLMGETACCLSDFVFITSDNPRSEDPGEIITDIIQGIDKEINNYKVVLDRQQAIFEALSFAQKYDTVVIAGKGHESRQIFSDKTIYFNDRKVAEEILSCLPLKK
jgi:UDP-N-acetylmuramoyl-L-alanyl-D-glutamate--2,6-diaminopimelate ligase